MGPVDGRTLSIEQKDVGLAGWARDAGPSRANDGYIAFLDADDACAPNRLGKRMEIFLVYPDFMPVCSRTGSLDYETYEGVFGRP